MLTKIMHVLDWITLKLNENDVAIESLPPIIAFRIKQSAMIGPMVK